METKEYFSFNINDHILVKLTDLGYEHMARNHNKLSHFAPLVFDVKTAQDFKSQADENGYTKFQAWDFISIFGPEVHMGMRPYFEMNILLEKHD